MGSLRSAPGSTADCATHWTEICLIGLRPGLATTQETVTVPDDDMPDAEKSVKEGTALGREVVEE